MGAIYWIVVVVTGYCALTAWVANLAWALRLRRVNLAVTLLILPALLVVLSPWLSQALRPLLFVVLLLGVTLALVRYLAPGNPLIPAKETKPAVLHLVLISGSALFLVPFVWMVVTSLKEDSQLAKLPPEWVPTQQVVVKYNGHDAGLVHTDVGGHSVLGLSFHANEDGSFQVLAPIKSPQNWGLGGQTGVVRNEPGWGPPRILTLTTSQFTEVRHPSPVWRNYPDALKYLPPSSDYGLVNLKNTLIIAILSVIGAVLSSSLVAYGFARLRWPGRDWVFGLLLATMMLPSAVTMMPTFLIFRSLGWVDTLRPLWVPSFFAAPFYVFLLRQFFMGIPKELEDAARIDGCSYLRTFWSVMLPMVRPALAAVTIMTFLASWKDFMSPLIYISSPEKMPLSYVLQLYNSAHGGEPTLLMAATTLVILPVLVLFFFTQRYFIEGISLTGMGGR